MPSVSRSTLCRNDIAPATAWPAPEMTLGASVYQPKPALMASPSRSVRGREERVDHAREQAAGDHRQRTRTMPSPAPRSMRA